MTTKKRRADSKRTTSTKPPVKSQPVPIEPTPEPKKLPETPKPAPFPFESRPLVPPMQPVILDHRTPDVTVPRPVAAAGKPWWNRFGL